MLPEELLDWEEKPGSESRKANLQKLRKDTRELIREKKQEEEEQKEVAALFNARIYPVENQAEREKALTETIVRVKKNSLEYRAAHLDPTDIAGLQQIINDQKKLDQMQNLHISID